jgi:hypothetical protein
VSAADLKPLYDRIAGKLSDEGWPAPRSICIYRFGPNNIVWRRGDSGSALCFGTEIDQLAVRHRIQVQIVINDRHIMIDVAHPLLIWPGMHDADTLVSILRHFRSVIDGG